MPSAKIKLSYRTVDPSIARIIEAGRKKGRKPTKEQLEALDAEQFSLTVDGKEIDCTKVSITFPAPGQLPLVTVTAYLDALEIDGEMPTEIQRLVVPS